MSEMKIVIVAGGGGHFSPALAIIQSLPKRDKVFVIGRKYTFEGDRAISLEYQTAQEQKIPFYTINAGRFQRKFSRYTIFSLLKFPYSFFEAYRLLNKLKPDVVLSFGGYVSLPVVFSSYLLRIPVVIHEQTLEAGLANKLASIFAKKICISYPSSRKFFPKYKVVLTGNPIRKLNNNASYSRIIKNINQKFPVVYITGGSSGSHAINTLIKAIVGKLLKKCIIIHQTGDSRQYHDFESIQSLRRTFSKALQERYIITKFVREMDVGGILKVASLVVSRAGINTISELLYFGKPAIVMPLPYAQKNEQKKNAILLKNLGMAEVIDQNIATPEMLYEQIVNVLKNIGSYTKNSSKVKQVIIANSTENVIKVVYDLVGK